jgi:hypothetical protein
MLVLYGVGEASTTGPQASRPGPLRETGRCLHTTSLYFEEFNAF